MFICVNVHTCMKMPTEATTGQNIPSETGITGHCKLPEVAPGNQADILWNSMKHS